MLCIWAELNRMFMCVCVSLSVCVCVSVCSWPEPTCPVVHQCDVRLFDFQIDFVAKSTCVCVRACGWCSERFRPHVFFSQPVSNAVNAAQPLYRFLWCESRGSKLQLFGGGNTHDSLKCLKQTVMFLFIFQLFQQFLVFYLHVSAKQLTLFSHTKREWILFVSLLAAFKTAPCCFQRQQSFHVLQVRGRAKK